jgi:hypothetical protein
LGLSTAAPLANKFGKCIEFLNLKTENYKNPHLNYGLTCSISLDFWDIKQMDGALHNKSDDMVEALCMVLSLGKVMIMFWSLSIMVSLGDMLSHVINRS